MVSLKFLLVHNRKLANGKSMYLVTYTIRMPRARTAPITKMVATGSIASLGVRTKMYLSYVSDPTEARQKVVGSSLWCGPY